MLGSRRGERTTAWSQPAVDLGTQLEDLFIHVVTCEKWAMLEDRIDLAVRTSGRHLDGDEHPALNG
jgi:hypothetical protein